MKPRSSILCLVLNLCLVPLALAQVPRFWEPPFIDADSSVFGSIMVADFNNDRIPDVATTSERDGSDVAIVLGLGHGTFAPTNIYFAGRGAQRFAVADLNGDGNLDLIMPDKGVDYVYWSTEISVLLGNGDGTFRPRVRYGAGPQPSSATVGDFNGDGKLDVVVSCDGGGVLALFFGNGDGTLQPVGQIEIQHSANRVVASDFNGDGNLDLAVSTSGKSVNILLGHGDGTFDPEHPYFVAERTHELLVADFNGDGNSDLAALAYSHIYVFIGKGDGRFHPEIDTPDPGDANGFVAGDVDGDGRVDLVVADGTASVFLGNGDGAFQPVVRYSPGGSVPGHTSGVAVGEFDGEPGLDVLSSAPILGTAGGFYLLSNRGDGTLQGLQAFTVQPFVTSSVSKDLNGDGKPDLVTGAFYFYTPVTSFVTVCLNNGNGQFGARFDYPTGADPESLAVEDVNGDGILDLVTANNDDDSISTFLGNGDGTFQERHDYATGGTAPLWVAVSDLNGDGLNDVVTTENESDQLSILLNVDGGFPSHTELATGDYPWSVVAEDLDRDGKSDLVVSYKGFAAVAEKAVSVFLGNGDGTFQSRVDYPLDTSSDEDALVGVADANRDGIKDLVAARSLGITSVFLGNGDGTFQTHLDSTGPYRYPTSMRLGDGDGDGKVDLLVGAYRIYFSRGNGDGTFQEPVSFLPNYGGVLDIADFNADGALDLASFNGGVGTILQNTGGSQVGLMSSKNPSQVGEEVIFSSAVTPTFALAQPTGTVKFYADKTLLGEAPLHRGRAKFSTSTLTAGTHEIKAIYSGNKVFVPNQSTERHQVVNSP